MGNSNAIFPKEEKVSADNFIGAAFVNKLIPDADNVYHSQVYDVVFEAGARNNCHKHPGGQILLATDGKGYYQEKGKAARLLQKGDVVTIPPNVEHWHGTAPDNSFTHIGISPNTQSGGAIWLSPVTNEKYQKATQ